MSQESHIDPARLYLFHRGELEDETIARHLESCATCQAELAMAADFDGTSEEPLNEVQTRRLHDAVLGAPGVTTDRPRSSRSPWISRGLLAAGVAALAIGVVRMAPQLRDPGGVTPSGQVRAPAADDWGFASQRHQDVLELQWSDDQRVTVQIHDAAGTVVHQLEVTGTVAQIPLATLEELTTRHGILFARLARPDGTLSPVLELGR